MRLPQTAWYSHAELVLDFAALYLHGIVAAVLFQSLVQTSLDSLFLMLLEAYDGKVRCHESRMVTGSWYPELSAVARDESNVFLDTSMMGRRNATPAKPVDCCTQQHLACELLCMSVSPHYNDARCKDTLDVTTKKPGTVFFDCKCPLYNGNDHRYNVKQAEACPVQLSLYR